MCKKIFRLSELDTNKTQAGLFVTKATLGPSAEN